MHRSGNGHVGNPRRSTEIWLEQKDGGHRVQEGLQGREMLRGRREIEPDDEEGEGDNYRSKVLEKTGGNRIYNKDGGIA